MFSCSYSYTKKVLTALVTLGWSVLCSVSTVFCAVSCDVSENQEIGITKALEIWFEEQLPLHQILGSSVSQLVLGTTTKLSMLS